MGGLCCRRRQASREDVGTERRAYWPHEEKLVQGLAGGHKPVRRGAVAVSALLATPAVASSSPAGPGELRLVVTPSVSLSTDPLSIRISGSELASG